MFDEGERARLDHFLDGEDALPISRSQLKRLCDDGRVTVNGTAVRAGHKLLAGDRIEVELPPPEPSEVVPEPMELVILYEDPDLIVIDKPAGLVVHPAAGHASGTLVNGLLHHCKDLSGIGGELRPGIVHRLDKDTSGVLVVAKSAPAHVALAQAFADKTLEREYVAVVAPPLRAPRGSFNTWFGRHPKDRKKFSSTVKGGKRAVTHYEVEERFGRLAEKVKVRLETGRTHQIRVHFADAGHAVVGDPLYGRTLPEPLREWAKELGRQALHARLLAFTHPISGKELSFTAEPPEDFALLLERLRTLPG